MPRGPRRPCPLDCRVRNLLRADGRVAIAPGTEPPPDDLVHTHAQSRLDCGRDPHRRALARCNKHGRHITITTPTHGHAAAFLRATNLRVPKVGPKASGSQRGTHADERPKASGAEELVRSARRAGIPPSSERRVIKRSRRASYRRHSYHPRLDSWKLQWNWNTAPPLGTVTVNLADLPGLTCLSTDRSSEVKVWGRLPSFFSSRVIFSPGLRLDERGVEVLVVQLLLDLGARLRAHVLRALHGEARRRRSPSRARRT